MILYLASDLIWATRIRRAADDLARTAAAVSETDGDLVQADLLIVDLLADDAIACIERARAAHADLPIVCFGPHVREDMLQAARCAGADLVLPRGAFDRRLGELLQGNVRKDIRCEP